MGSNFAVMKHWAEIRGHFGDALEDNSPNFLPFCITCKTFSFRNQSQEQEPHSPSVAFPLLTFPSRLDGNISGQSQVHFHLTKPGMLGSKIWHNSCQVLSDLQTIGGGYRKPVSL